MKNGSFWPSYVLCYAQSSSDKRSGYRVIKQFEGSKKFYLPKVLVTSIYGHDELLDYLSDYRTQDKMYGVHYYPSGALCWLETNQYGDPVGSIYIVRKVPDLKLLEKPMRERGMRKLLQDQNRKLTLNEKFAKEKPDTEQWNYEKPRFNIK